ncbi:hypothetical protein OG21DRAFT_1380494, partial [Imleria badia]
KDGSIKLVFEQTGKEQVTYSYRVHTREETGFRPFSIVEDEHFQVLMKTERPYYYLPLRWTVARDVHLVFAWTRKRIATMLKEYNGKMNFMTDAWSSPNHWAFVALT